MIRLSEEERSVVELAIDHIASGQCEPKSAVGSACGHGAMFARITDLENAVAGDGYTGHLTADERVARLRRLLELAAPVAGRQG